MNPTTRPDGLDPQKIVRGPAPKPTIGRIVHYRLSKSDVDNINQKRRRAGTATQDGNDPVAGNVLPAIVVAFHDEPQPSINAQVFLDGNDTFWATSRFEGTGEGQWFWPPRT